MFRLLRLLGFRFAGLQWHGHGQGHGLSRRWRLGGAQRSLRKLLSRQQLSNGRDLVLQGLETAVCQFHDAGRFLDVNFHVHHARSTSESQTHNDELVNLHEAISVLVNEVEKHCRISDLDPEDGEERADILSLQRRFQLLQRDLRRRMFFHRLEEVVEPCSHRSRFTHVHLVSQILIHSRHRQTLIDEDARDDVERCNHSKTHEEHKQHTAHRVDLHEQTDHIPPIDTPRHGHKKRQ
mmetsp:Transcript_48794/g.129336  ORF Transcript_48794/g.129336 Transcript_48794/m.129336 type:complete len:237 (+) Transcript_48794:169-879(+)